MSDTGSILADFQTRLDRQEYPITPGSPWPSELAAVVDTARRHGVTTLLEGGTFYGQSAAVFNALIPAFVWTFEIDPEIANTARHRFAALRAAVEVITGDAYLELPPFARYLNDRPEAEAIGVFLDGPKGTPALTLVQILMESSLEHLRFIAVHDTYPSTMGRPNPIHLGLNELGDWTPGWRRWTTEDPRWIATGSRALDVGLFAQHRRFPHGWEPYRQYRHGEPFPMTSYGPTVTILERQGVS